MYASSSSSSRNHCSRLCQQRLDFLRPPGGRGEILNEQNHLYSSSSSSSSNAGYAEPAGSAATPATASSTCRSKNQSSSDCSSRTSSSNSSSSGSNASRLLEIHLLQLPRPIN
ncbi:hypothetical protein Efla_006207 [Eimeria flavescens]